MDDLIPKEPVNIKYTPARAYNLMMNWKKKKIILITALPLLLAALLAPRFAGSDPITYEWGTRKDRVMSRYIGSAEHTSFTPSSKPEYENKILNFILAINSDMKERIVILRTAGGPMKDYLLINDKLYSVLENYGTMPASTFERVISDLSSKYKTPTIQKDKSMTTYSFQDKESKVLVLSYQKQNLVDCNIYHYASRLFRILITE